MTMTPFIKSFDDFYFRKTHFFNAPLICFEVTRNKRYTNASLILMRKNENKKIKILIID